MSSAKIVAPSSTCGHLAVLDPPRQPFGQRRLAHARIADIERVVLGAPAEHLDGALDLGIAADERVDPPSLGLGVQVDAIGVERRRPFLDDVSSRASSSAPETLPPCADWPGHLGDPVRDVVDRVVARHVLLLQEVDRVGLALGEDRHQDVGAGDLGAAGRLHVEDRALHHPLEAGRGLGLDRLVGGEALQLLVDEGLELAFEPLQIDAAGLQHRDGVGILQQRVEQVLERRELVPPLDRKRERPVQALFEIAREHASATPFPSCTVADARCAARIRRPASPWSRRPRRSRRRRHRRPACARGA